MKIKEIAFFNNIEINDIEYNIREYSKNKTVYNHYDKCDSMDFVLSGSLVAYSLSANGSENIVFNFVEGDIIGANLIFGSNNKYPMNIYCTENCKLLHLKKKEIEKLLEDYNFSMNFIKSISNNSQGMNKKIAIYTQKTLRENILEYFHALSLEQDSKIIVLPVSKKQLADYFGVQRPSLFRELKKMKEENIIQIDGKKVEIK